MSILIGGGRCSICGSYGTNKVSCPLRDGAKNGGDIRTHPKAAEMLGPKAIKERSQPKISFVKVKKLQQLTDAQRMQRMERIKARREFTK